MGDKLGIPPYVVRITGQSQRGAGFNGTGFIVSPKGHVVTCSHVVVHDGKPAREIKIYVPGHAAPWQYILRDSSEADDLVVLEGVVRPTNETPCATLHTHWHATAETGQQVAIFGHSSANNYPSGQRYQCSISGFSEKDGRVGVFGDINPGDSGGPVLDEAELVIGIIHARDRTRTGQARFIPTSLLIRLLEENEIPFRGKTQSEVSYTHNPFTWRRGIDSADAFFNRKSEQYRLRDCIHTRQTCQIVGERRIGKTSLLWEIERSLHEWEQRAVIAHVDLHDARCKTLSGWLAWVSQKLSWTKPATSLIEFNHGIGEMISRKLIPVLLLDEFEEFARRRDQFDRDFFSNLRSCAGKGMAIITASRKYLNELTDPDDPTSPFYNIFTPLELGPFSNKDVDSFLSLARPNIPQFELVEKEAIQNFCKGYPLALQVACFHVVDTKKNGLPLDVALQRASQELKAYWPPNAIPPFI